MKISLHDKNDCLLKIILMCLPAIIPLVLSGECRADADDTIAITNINGNCDKKSFLSFGYWDGADKYEGKFDADTKHSGKASVMVRNVGDTGKAGWWTPKGIAVKENTSYIASFYVRAKNATTGYFQVSFPNTGHPQVLDDFDKGSYEWTKKEVSFLTPKGTKAVKFHFFNTGKGTFWFDELSLLEADNPKTATFDGSTFLYKPRYEKEDPPLSDVGFWDRWKGYITYQRKDPRWIYPNSVPQPGEMTRELRSFGTPGQYVALWFCVYALEDLKDVTVKVMDDLSLDSENAIRKEDVNVKLIRCWPQRAAWGGNSYYVIPECLERFEKTDIPKNETQGFWIQVKIPPGAKPGDWATRVRIDVARGSSRNLDVNIKVLPFALETPQGINWLMCSDLTYQPLSRMTRYLKDMKEYGITGVIIQQTYDRGFIDGEDGTLSYHSDFLAHALKTLKSLGMDKVVGLSNDSIRNFDEQKLKKVLCAIDCFMKKNGVNEWCWQGIDEPGCVPARMEIALRIYKWAKDVGVKTYCTCYNYDDLAKLMPFIDAGIITTDHGKLAKFKSLAQTNNASLWFLGGGIYTGQEGGLTPDRYLSGYDFYKTGLPVHESWTYQRPLAYKGDPYSDFDGTTKGGQPKEYAITYPARKPTDDEVSIMTLQWEGIREGIDDYKYAYTLTQWIKKAREKGHQEEAAKSEQRLNALMEGVPWSEDYQCGNCYSKPGNFSNDTAVKHRWWIAQEIMKLQKIIGE